jgi:hypothetical protein
MTRGRRRLLAIPLAALGVAALIAVNTGDAPATGALGKTFNSTQTRGTNITITVNGQITAFTSPNVAGATYQHVYSEGYVVCYNAVNSYDIGGGQSGWVPTATELTNTSTKYKLQRNTVDGIVQLTQTFTFDGKHRSLDIRMDVKNLSGAAITNVVLRRLMDMDVDSYGADGWAGNANNWFSTKDSVTAWEDTPPAGKEAHALRLGHVISTSGIGHTARITGTFDTTCSPASAGTLLSSVDRVASMAYALGTIAAGATKQGTVRYSRN